MKAKIISFSDLVKFFPQEVLLIFDIFNKISNDSIRLVGGCVRDLVLQKNVKDFDFATKFLPLDVINILEKNNIKTVPTGLKYGTITAFIGDKSFEITTLRKDLESDGRHPKTEFVDDYFFDAARRDFTINALYLDNKGFLHDYFDGIEDLKNQKVNFIGDAYLRINEDFLRILRFFRFSCEYAKNLDNKGLDACIKNKDGINFLSSDRIRNEFFKILSTKNNQKLLEILEIVENKNIREEFFAAKFQIKNFAKILEIEKRLNIDIALNLKFFILIFNSEEKINLDEILLRFNFSNEEKKYFYFFNNQFSKNQKILDNQTLKELLVYFDRKYVFDFYLLKLIFLDNLNHKKIKSDLNFILQFEIPTFPLTGQDLIELGFQEGRVVGEIISVARKYWIESDFKIDKKKLIDFCFQKKV